ncbi:MAG: hypothetical protein A3C35_03575 [Omnitrophica bacterium RIFCSPHIGHO2_02_FULL_46_11]|nr:MAG: hypothetical protein A3A81_01350 [Omnitrophica bacterium RIFCSPLOWO2_01_FULL_45_10b]OGW87402.1 MAG: hypothetical protein A3C35_03575 [Omnitrophica bacterium RIFCSPHIGHO2_02_FULL_46_11]
MNILMIAGSFLMAKEIFNRKTAILTAAFIGICPYFLHLSNEIRSYSTLSCFATFATYFFFKARNNPLRKIWKITYALFVLLTIYTEHFGWFCLFGISTYLLFILLTNWNHEKEWMWVQGLVFLISIPSVLLIFYQALNDESVLVGSKLAPYRDVFDMIKKSFGIFWHFICGPIYSMLPVQRVIGLAQSSFPFWVSFTLTLTFLTLYFKALGNLFRSDKPLFILSISIILFPVVFLLSVYPIRLDSRYLCWAVPLFFSLIAFAILSMKSSLLRNSVIGGFFICAMIADIYIILIPTDPKHKEDYRAMLKYSLEQSGKNDAIVGVGPQTTYYLSEIGINAKGAYYHNMPDAINSMEPAQFEQVWALLYIDMKPEITNRVLSEIDAMLLPLSYIREGELIRFGGADSLTAIQVYKNKNRLSAKNRDF